MAKIAARPCKRPVELPAPEAPPAEALAAPHWSERDDVRLFAMTFIGGFVFTSLFIA